MQHRRLVDATLTLRAMRRRVEVPLYQHEILQALRGSRTRSRYIEKQARQKDSLNAS